ncbi:3-phosphoshikimate 1-carboxyvinyltransferase [uncultured Dysosmobacter sp.]|uniref:3-phosphoshikimate 1-carboxyvinyltransferase n=1 Tax=uncultured Dysosmobacter sp. TaxID=2591384 RepID=UPI00260839B9|nr:3-phosphoshikimate 1-carboxyvinyltransferase [uncultured Dysosmobacter sp.]
MDVLIEPVKYLDGSAAAIPSKSDVHRKLICAALADRPTELILSEIPHVRVSADIEATMACLTALGASFRLGPSAGPSDVEDPQVHHPGASIFVTPIQEVPKDPLLDCGESGSTFRFLLPVAAALCGHVRFTGSGRLPERPIGDLMSAMTAHGVSFSAEKLPFETHGKLTGGDYALPGNISSQYITGLLLALPNAAEDSTLTLTTKLESAAYVDITLAALRRFGISVRPTGTGWAIPGKQAFHAGERCRADGDWSNAAFFLTAGALGKVRGHHVALLYADDASPQGDKAIVPLLRKFRADVRGSGSFFLSAPSQLYPAEIDVSEVPDLLPILAVAAAFAKGKSHFTNAARLRLKESDRLKTTAAMLKALGGKAVEQPAGLIVHGGRPLTGGTVDGANDHRIVMAAAIAAAYCKGPTAILGAQAVNKSYPGFWEDYKQLGGVVHVL